MFEFPGFPAYLAAAGLGQAPAMYGYGSHQLEDLAALQRSTLAASLPQLVGAAQAQQQGQQQAKPAVRYILPSRHAVVRQTVDIEK